jgi:hypothetical protein
VLALPYSANDLEADLQVGRRCEMTSVEADLQVGHVERARCGMTVKCRTFTSGIKSWEKLAGEAAAFATEVGKDRLINISVSAAGGGDLSGFGAEGVIFVWYWE